MKRTMLTLAIAFGLSIPAPAQDYDYYDLTQPVRPLQPVVPTYQLPSVPTMPTPNHDPFGVVDNILRGIGNPPPRRQINPCDYTRQFRPDPVIQQQWRDTDRAMQRNYWAGCAKYNRHCANMLRSLGGR